MRMQGGSDGETHAIWEPEEDPNQPGVGCLFRGLRVSRGSSWQEEEMGKQKREEEMLT